MSKLTAFFLVWSCSFCYAVQVYATDAQGRVTWKDSPVWRDRSAVPTPQPDDVEAYKKRAEIPHMHPRIVKHVYIGPQRNIGKERKINKKKNIIQKIFFSMPVGAELPIYYTHKQVQSHKKSTVASSEVSDMEGSRYFSEETNGPFRTNTWGLQQQLAGNDELSPVTETRTIAEQNLLPSEREIKRHGIGGEFLRPRTINRYRVFNNNRQVFKRPSRTQGLLNVYRRSDIQEKKTKRKDHTETKKISSDKNTKKSGLPKGIPQAFPLPWLL